jgi:leucyl aminopeptidase
MKVTVENYSGKSKINQDTLIFCDYKKGSLLEQLDKKFAEIISEFIKSNNFKFDLGETLVIELSKHVKVSSAFKSIKKIILVGLAKENIETNKLRKAYAAAIREARNIKANKIAFWHPEKADLLAETAILVSYDFLKYKNEKLKSKKHKIQELKIFSSNLDTKTKKQVKTAIVTADATCIARDLVWEPACAVTPTYLAQEAKKIKANNLKITVKEAAECKKLGMGAFLAVAQGSDQAPKFIEFSYKPKGKIKKHIALVGKGVTFDSGGLSLKPAKSMEMMKEDMAGSAAIIGIMNAIAALQPANLQITAIIAATENMPSGKAYRPGDVITAMNGKTIEVNNTDAEGRLTLADAVAYVSTKNPDEIIDFATLTGACVVALGNIAAAIMSNDERLTQDLKDSALSVGEKIWQLPLYDEYKESLESSIADLINAGSKGKAGAQNGAMFIQEFVGKRKNSDEYIPWAHLDIAGPCWFDQEMDWSPKGASGIPVRTVLNYILSH